MSGDGRTTDDEVRRIERRSWFLGGAAVLLLFAVGSLGIQVYKDLTRPRATLIDEAAVMEMACRRAEELRAVHPEPSNSFEVQLYEMCPAAKR